MRHDETARALQGTGRDYPALPAGPAGPPSSERPIRVCIVTREVVGPHRCGGVGMAYTTLAEVLAHAGHEVTVLYVKGELSEDRPIGYWIDHYADLGIRLAPLPPCSPRVRAEWPITESYAVYLWLRDQQPGFDVVHFSEWCGAGYFAALAKKLGLAFGRTTMCLGGHGTWLWIREAHGWPLRELTDVIVSYLERRSVELADVVVSPSRYMLEWYRRHGWRTPERVFVQPNILPPSARFPVEGRPRTVRVCEFVFFGRLEDRKGVVTFCDALDRLTGRGVGGFRVTFLGKPALVERVHAEGYLRWRAKAWPFPWQILGDRTPSGAMAYLRQPERLAVMPSQDENSPYTVLECLGAGVPFVASRVGGIPELVAEGDRDAVLVAPQADALADRLAAVLRDGARVAGPAVDVEANEHAWTDWHAMLGKEAPAAGGASSDRPLVTVCLPRGADPVWRAHAAEAVEQQDYERRELLLTDGGLAVPQEARGDYVLFLGEGELPRPGMLSTFVKAAVRTGADVLTCCVDYLEADPASGAPGAALERAVPLGPAASVGLFRNCFGSGTMLVRRDALRALGGAVPESAWAFCARAVLGGLRLEAVPEPLCWAAAAGRKARSPAEAEAERRRGIMPYLEVAPAGLEEVLLYAQGMEVTGEAGAAAMQAELARYRNAYEALLNRPPVRLYRAAKRALRALLGGR